MERNKEQRLKEQVTTKNRLLHGRNKQPSQKQPQQQQQQNNSLLRKESKVI